MLGNHRVPDSSRARQHPLPTLESVLDHNRRWGANCGPYAASAALGTGLHRLHTEFLPRNWPGYTNERTMRAILEHSGRQYHRVRSPEVTDTHPGTSVYFVQIIGPWCGPGVPARARYRHTHWVASRTGGDIADINNPGLWMSRGDWLRFNVPVLLVGHKRATGIEFKVALVLPETTALPRCAR